MLGHYLDCAYTQTWEATVTHVFVMMMMKSLIIHVSNKDWILQVYAGRISLIMMVRRWNLALMVMRMLAGVMVRRWKLQPSP